MTDCVTRWRFQKSQLKHWDQFRDVDAQYELHSVWTQSHHCLEHTRKSLDSKQRWTRERHSLIILLRGMKSDRQAHSNGSTVWS